jgi:glucosamine--fructose-6-phosphate aminotransferase (isomerizing)
MNETRLIDVMLDEIKLTPEVIRQNIKPMREAARLALKKTLDGEIPPRIYLTGCGDSYYTGMAARLAFERYTGIATEAIEAMEFCRYYVDTMPENSLVIPLSYSGSAARTIECARAGRVCGGKVMAVTGKAGGGLAKESNNFLLYNIKSLGFAPGTISYSAMLLQLYLIALEIGVIAGKLTDAEVEEVVSDLYLIADITEETIKENTKPAHTYAAIIAKDVTEFCIIGAGPNLATSHFAAAKLLEGPQISGVPQQLEEWAHEQYFITTPDTHTWVIAPSGNSLDRAGELLREMNFINTNSVLITDSTTYVQAEPLATWVFKNSGSIREELSPLTMSIIPSLIAYFLAVEKGKSSYNFQTPGQEKEHYDTIHKSKFRWTNVK